MEGVLLDNERLPYNFNMNQKTRKILISVTAQGCWHSGSHKTLSEGYPVIVINGIREKLYRVLYRRMYGSFEKGTVLRHLCDDRLCVNPNHIIPGTHVDNVRDRVERDRSAKGESHGRAKLKEDDVRWTRANLNVTKSEVARKYNVTRKVIRDVINGITWKHLGN